MSKTKKFTVDQDAESKARRKFIKDLAKVSAAFAAVNMAGHLVPESAEAQLRRAEPMRRMQPMAAGARIERAASFQRRLFTDTNFLRTFCQNPAQTMKSAGLAVPATGVPGSLRFDAAQFVVRNIVSNHGSFDNWANAHGGLKNDMLGKTAIAAV